MFAVVARASHRRAVERWQAIRATAQLVDRGLPAARLVAVSVRTGARILFLMLGSATTRHHRAVGLLIANSRQFEISVLLLLFLLELESGVAAANGALLSLRVRLVHASVGVAADATTPNTAHSLVLINTRNRFELVLIVLVPEARTARAPQVW